MTNMLEEVERDDRWAVLLIELRGVYDGWSVAVGEDGTMANRWHPNDSRYARTQQFIDSYGGKYTFKNNELGDRPLLKKRKKNESDESSVQQ